MVENFWMQKAEYLPGPSIEGQTAARRNLDKILQHLENDEVCESLQVYIIRVWGVGGIGKTTLVKNLKNELQQIDVSISSKLSFGVVVWAAVPKPPIDIRKVQALIADRLNVKVNTDQGSVESNASKIYVGDVDNWKDIEPLAMERCFAITVIGASMRGKKMIEQWKDALESLRKSEPNDKDTGDKVYQVIKWSFDSLENKRSSDIQSCFLYCSLYPAAIPTNTLIDCWWAEGFLGEHI